MLGLSFPEKPDGGGGSSKSCSCCVRCARKLKNEEGLASLLQEQAESKQQGKCNTFHKEPGGVAPLSLAQGSSA